MFHFDPFSNCIQNGRFMLIRVIRSEGNSRCCGWGDTWVLEAEGGHPVLCQKGDQKGGFLIGLGAGLGAGKGHLSPIFFFKVGGVELGSRDLDKTQ